MKKGRSIDVGQGEHVNPIPCASRRGPFVVPGAISGVDPGTVAPPAPTSNAGGWRHRQMTVWITDRSLRDIMNCTGRDAPAFALRAS
jgi:hypothetical protein